ncbi:MAG: hypothetical protein AAFV45_11595 [Pseudomonadota bacterium]
MVLAYSQDGARVKAFLDGVLWFLKGLLFVAVTLDTVRIDECVREDVMSGMADVVPRFSKHHLGWHALSGRLGLIQAAWRSISLTTIGTV